MITSEEYEAHIRFEAEVRRVGEALWGLQPGECAPEHYTGDTVVSELDGLVRLPDVTHLIMVTVSRKLEKVRGDVGKLIAAEKIEKRRGFPTIKWFITLHELNAEHIKYCRDNGVTALSIASFKARFFDGRNYISKRRPMSFGSARNLSDNSVNIPEDEYVALPLKTIFEGGRRLMEPVALSLGDLTKKLGDGNVVVLLAPFGAGKSLTAREVFFKLSSEHLRDSHARVPIAINLRDHWGSKYADEILERHAREVGLPRREELVVAWRAGLATMILDGFDEVAAQVVARANDRAFMRQARLEALRGLQDLTQKLPGGAGVLITGRDHYFDTVPELVHALGLTAKSVCIVELGEFGEKEAAAYLKKKGVTGLLPAWLPRKPLLLGYLSSRGLLEQVLEIDGSAGFGFAWNEFLTRICEREAAYAMSAMDATTLMRLLQRLAFEVRATASGSGPIAERDLADAYFAVTGDNPDDAVLMQLQRLPGLTARGQDAGIRSFIDEDMLAALQGGALANYMLEGRATWTRRGIRAPLGQQAIATAAYLVSKAGGNARVAIAAANRASSASRGEMDPQIACDCLEVAFQLTNEEETLDCDGLSLEGVYLGRLPIEGNSVEGLTLRDSLIDDVFLDERGLRSNVRVERCDIQRVSGVASNDALPTKLFVDCTVELFDDLSTNASIVRSELPPKLKALLTILRKLYVQAGGGRKLSALKRGLPPGPIVDAVDELVDRLESEGLLEIHRNVAHPVRKHAPRVRAILSAAGTSTDPLVREVLGG